MVWGKTQVSYKLVNSKKLNPREVKQDAVLKFLGRTYFCFQLKILSSSRIMRKLLERFSEGKPTLEPEVNAYF